MTSNILITGAAGYIGGSIITDFISGIDALFQKEHVFGTARSEDQAKALSTQGIKVLQLDLTNEEAVVEALEQHNIHIVIHTASSINSSLATNLINGLAKQREATGTDRFFIHTSGGSVFSETAGWPSGEVKDTDAVFGTERELADSFPLRKADVTIIEHAKAKEVKSFIVVPTVTYGRGTGVWNQVSVVIPAYVRAAVTKQQIYRFDENITNSAIHISDLTRLYAQIVRKILSKDSIPSGEQGYYFGISHRIHMWEVLDHLSSVLASRGIITADSTIREWPSNEFAAEALGVPVEFLQVLWKSGDDMTPERPYQIGWRPTWTYDRFLRSLDDEVQDVLELGKAKSSLIDSLFKAAKQG